MLLSFQLADYLLAIANKLALIFDEIGVNNVF